MNEALTKSLIKSFYISSAITLITSFGLFLRMIGNGRLLNWIFEDRDGKVATYIFEKILPILSGFPLRAFSLCSSEFDKCIWTQTSKFALIYNFIVWFVIVFVIVEIFRRYRAKVKVPERRRSVVSSQ